MELAFVTASAGTGCALKFLRARAVRCGLTMGLTSTTAPVSGRASGPVVLSTRTWGVLRRFVGPVGLSVWAALSFVVLGTLMVGHWFALPAPGAGERASVAQAIGELRDPGADPRWFAVHVLYAECRCSQRIFDHLFTRPRPSDLAEHVLLVGHDEDLAAAARARGYGVTTLAPDKLASRFSLKAAPLLLVADPEGTLRYAGGYTERKQGPDIRDVAIIEALQAEHAVAELPPFGCAVSRSLQKLLDPLGFKYASQEIP